MAKHRISAPEPDMIPGVKKVWKDRTKQAGWLGLITVLPCFGRRIFLTPRTPYPRLDT